MKNSILITLTLASALVLTLGAFTSSTKETPEFIVLTMPLMETAKSHTLEVLDAMPAENFNYQPTEVNKTFGSQMVHIGYSLHYFSEAMMKGNRIKYEEPDASTMSKDEIRGLVAKGFDDMMAAMGTLSSEDLAAELPFGKNTTITRGQAVIFAHDHVTNHRAKANLYLRMNGIEPPNYKFL
ncbi:DinB family protein [Fulvivirga sedimenti]|uniref:DinB family protein n=1 Tax=Fulvivirga sedimenti TaxID=2879465 RepID=A0A9X1L0E2_9BACT|nr:DinB family protein [Fulvivirga sedimenti]MCA6074559.1 DinB family protein [Fulvivirga sedimenti]MCA6075736.1 DinB family protein [Fulvivirga sedimenti]MCA6076864.1 DinB family protein [Fulvivirga sedimenti]